MMKVVLVKAAVHEVLADAIVHELIKELALDEGAGVVLEALVVRAVVHELLVELSVDVQAIVMMPWCSGARRLGLSAL